MLKISMARAFTLTALRIYVLHDFMRYWCNVADSVGIARLNSLVYFSDINGKNISLTIF